MPKSARGGPEAKIGKLLCKLSTEIVVSESPPKIRNLAIKMSLSRNFHKIGKFLQELPYFVEVPGKTHLDSQISYFGRAL